MVSVSVFGEEIEDISPQLLASRPVRLSEEAVVLAVVYLEVDRLEVLLAQVFNTDPRVLGEWIFAGSSDKGWRQ